MDDVTQLGLRELEVHDPTQGARVPVRALYPAHAPPASVAFGPYTVEAAVDAAPTAAAAERLPVVVVSHGSGGTPWGYRAIALAVARAGHVVVMLTHPGNTRGDDGLAGTADNLVNRPRHVRLALDALAADAVLGPHVGHDRAAVIGHSLGGYTALAAAGGRPVALPDSTEDGRAHPLEVEHDARVDAVVLLGPALPWLMAPGALAEVRARVMVRAGERDELAPPYAIEAVLRGLPAGARLDVAVVPGAGHFAWFGPVPPPLAGPHFPPSIDPPGFDRAAYLPRVAAEIVAFLRAAA